MYCISQFNFNIPVKYCSLTFLIYQVERSSSGFRELDTAKRIKMSQYRHPPSQVLQINSSAHTKSGAIRKQKRNWTCKYKQCMYVMVEIFCDEILMCDISSHYVEESASEIRITIV